MSVYFFFFFKQKTAYEMRISDWSSDVCSSDLREQTVLYETLVRESMERIERADEHARRGLVLALLTGLKQICNHPAHYLKQGGGRLAGRSEKLDLLDELLGTVLAEDGAVLVFTQYVAMARLLSEHLVTAGVDQDRKSTRLNSSH